MEKPESRCTFDFVIDVLRIHEKELNRLISDLELVTNNVEKWADKVREIMKDQPNKSEEKPRHSRE